MKKEFKPITVWFPCDEIDRIKAIATAENRDMSKQIRHAVNQYGKKEQGK